MGGVLRSSAATAADTLATSSRERASRRRRTRGTAHPFCPSPFLVAKLSITSSESILTSLGSEWHQYSVQPGRRASRGGEEREGLYRLVVWHAGLDAAYVKTGRAISNVAASGKRSSAGGSISVTRFNAGRRPYKTAPTSGDSWGVRHQLHCSAAPACAAWRRPGPSTSSRRGSLFVCLGAPRRQKWAATTATGATDEARPCRRRCRDPSR
eukprot:scaffold1340_cov253-Pinguiococcus_pyrenoidosus.AAC.44